MRAECFRMRARHQQLELRSTCSPSEVRHAQANSLARRREKFSAHYCLNPSSTVSVRFQQLSIACSHGRPKVLFQRLARDGALNGTLADVSIKDDEAAVTGNNEVRILANSVASADGTFQLDKTIKYDPAKSILSYKIGDKVSLSADEFTRLSQAFFVEIEPKYP